jgi:hypothetical protein
MFNEEAFSKSHSFIHSVGTVTEPMFGKSHPFLQSFILELKKVIVRKNLWKIFSHLSFAW